MNRKTKKQKSNPYPIRFDDDERKQIGAITDAMGMSIPDVVRLAVRFTAPKLLSGELTIKDLVELKQKAAA